MRSESRQASAAVASTSGLIAAACPARAVSQLADSVMAATAPATPSVATEMMMTASLMAAENFVEIPDEWKELPWDGAGILVEFRSDDESSLAEQEAQALAVMEGRELLREPSR